MPRKSKAQINIEHRLYSLSEDYCRLLGKRTKLYEVAAQVSEEIKQLKKRINDLQAEEKKYIVKNLWDEHYHDALRYELGGRIPTSRQFAVKPEPKEEKPLPQFKRAEIVFERFVEEGTSLKRYRFKKFINIATERELPIGYKKIEPWFCGTKDGKQLCLHSGGKELWYSCIEFSESELTESNYKRFVSDIKHCGERLHNIMERERDIANHKGEHKVTI